MSIALITTSTKKRNGVHCCVIHETKYIVDILCTVITLLNNEINLYMKKCFFQTYKTVTFHFFEKPLKCLLKHKCFYISMMKPEAAIGGVL